MTLPILPWHQDTTQLQQKSNSDTSDSDSEAKYANSTPKNPILNRLMDPPTSWDKELWHHITCHLRHNDLNHQLITGQPIIACSNAAVDTANFSTFSWIIYSHQALWQGKGVVPGLVDDMYSGRSEAFRVLTILQFLKNYLANYPNTYQQSPTINIYCDNQGVLDRVGKTLAMKPIQSGLTMTDDYDVYAEICSAILDMPLITTRLTHIKGHQDKGPHQKHLSLPARLNIECNKRATDYLPIARRMKPQPNLMLPHRYPHLAINGHTIVRDLQTSLCNAVSTQDYRAYMCKKHKWTSKDCNNVNWQSLKLALRQFKRNDQQRLQKFLHDWLPLQASEHSTQPAGDRLCPTCHMTPETFWHFLECQHPSRETAYRQLQNDIRKQHESNRIDPHMLQLLWQGLNLTCQQYPIDDQLATYPAEFHQLYIDQSRLGWEQLYYGQISTSWAHYINHSSQYKINGTVFYSQLMATIWRYILSSWTTCNAALHPAQPTQRTVLSLTPQVLHLFRIVAKEPALHGHEPTATPDQILQQPVCYIQNFLNTGFRQFQTHATAARTRAINHTRDIQSYFNQLLDNKDDRPP